MSYRELPAGVYRRLCANLQGAIKTDLPTRTLYSTDSSIYQIMPLAVVFPCSASDLQTLVGIAHDTQTPVIFRGGGTGLAGETLGEAIIADCSRHMDNIEAVDVDRNIVRVQSGLVLERLNHYLASFGKQIGPDPGSATRCTIGGMVANNAAGMHSLLHGVTRDNIVSLELVLSDGSRLEVGSDASDPAPNTLAERIYAGLEALLSQHADLIEAKTPRHLKRHRAGYLLHDVLQPLSENLNTSFDALELRPLGSASRLDMAKLICGSEGTLAAVASATLKLSDRLKNVGLGLFCFSEVAQAADAVPLILTHSPASVEMLDQSVLRMAREAGRISGDLVPAEAASVLMVEFCGESEQQIKDQLEKVRQDLRANTPAMEQVVLATDPAERQRIWAVRSSSEPLLNRRPGRKRAIAFVEDAAVGTDRLGEYIRHISQVFNSRGIEFGAYGHAGVGVLHVRPFLDISDPKDRQQMAECADEIYDAVLSMGGSVSGEHGDGLVRTQYLPKQYGDLYPVFGEVKALLDPRGILNPDKIWRPVLHDTLTENLLRSVNSTLGSRSFEVTWAEGEFARELDRCNRCGECKIINRSHTMCPSHKDYKDEAGSPRAKATLLRALVNGTLDESFFADPKAKEIMDRCINCKGCHLECPLNVNIPKLMLEAKAQYVRQNGQDLPNLFLALSEYSSILCALFSPIVNAANRNKLARQAMEWATGIDARRPLPDFRFTLLNKFRLASPRPSRPVAKVALFLDLYGRYNDPKITFDFLDILRANNVRVTIPAQRASGLPAMDYASMGIARSAIMDNAHAFAKAIKQGYTVVTTEPSAALALREEALAFSDHPLVKQLAEHTIDAMQFLANLKHEGKFNTQGLKPINLRLGHHVPCHVKALESQGATPELLSTIPGIEVISIEEGCCGIAGTWGMKKANYEESIRIGLPLFEVLRNPSIDKGLSECSTCRMQMEHGSRKAAVHPITILAQAYRKK